jgi:hypothetical protein
MGQSANRDGDGLFRTRDLPLAAWLNLHGQEHMRIEKRGRVGYWIFTRTPELDDLVDAYGEGEVRLNVKDFLDCVHDVRSDLYSRMGLG